MWIVPHAKSPERRQVPRVRFSGGVTLETAGGAIVYTWGANVSEGGMLVHSKSATLLEAGAQVKVLFQLPDTDQTLESIAQIVYKRYGSWIGLRFLSLQAKPRRMLATYVFTGSGRVREYFA